MATRWVTLSLLVLLSATMALGQEPTQPLEISNGVAQGLLVKKVAPVYPPLARQARIQGTVVLNVIINKSGDVASLKLFSGHPMLAPAAIEAVKQWKYQPFIVDGKPVDVETEIRVNFVLTDKPQGTADDRPGALQAALTGTEPRVRVAEGVMRVLRIQELDPIYPPAALQQHASGLVTLTAHISTSGEVGKVEALSGHPLLVPATIEAVKQWKYMPYLLNGQPVVVETTIRLNYAISPDNPNEGTVSDAPLDAAPTNGVVGGVFSPAPPPGDAPGGSGPVIGVQSDKPPGTPRATFPQRVRVSAGVASGLLLSKVNPVYPPEARDQQIQGVVLLQVRIDKEGNISDISLISGPRDLAPAAIDAVKQWKYRPYLLNGTPVMVETEVQVKFMLAD